MINDGFWRSANDFDISIYLLPMVELFALASNDWREIIFSCRPSYFLSTQFLFSQI